MLRWLAPLLPPVRRHEFPHAQEVIDRVLAGARRGIAVLRRPARSRSIGPVIRRGP
jgi:hypothetical protein